MRPGWIDDGRFGIATKVLGRDKGVSVGEAEAVRDIDWRSRPGLACLRSRPEVSVMTWLGW